MRTSHLRRPAIEVSIDVRCLQDAAFRETGIGNYTRGFISRLIESPLSISFLIDKNMGALPAWPQLSRGPIYSYLDMRGGCYISPSFMTHNCMPFALAKLSGNSTICVVHDLIPLRRPFDSRYNNSSLFSGALQLAATSDCIVAVSMTTKTDINSFFQHKGALDIAPEILVVRPESRFVDDTALFRGKVELRKDRSPYRKPYVFFAAADHPRKNLEIALQSAEGLAALGYDVVVGGGVSESTRSRLSSATGSSRVAFTPRLSDPELAEAYVGSEVVIVPSLDEGFSMPVIEALSLGCRVVVSDIEAHREQVQDARYRFDPTDVNDLIDKVGFAAKNGPPEFKGFSPEREFRNLIDRIMALSRTKVATAD